MIHSATARLMIQQAPIINALLNSLGLPKIQEPGQTDPRLCARALADGIAANHPGAIQARCWAMSRRKAEAHREPRVLR